MSVEQIYVKDGPESVIRKLSLYFQKKGWSGGLSAPIQFVPLATRDFDKKRSRHFALSMYPNGWNALVEAGDLADWRLARHLAEDTKVPLLVIALHESSNAWAYVLFEEGKRKEYALRPPKLFLDVQFEKSTEESWDGDAWAEAHAVAEKYELPEPFLSYQQIAKYPKALNRFLSYRRNE